MTDPTLQHTLCDNCLCPTVDEQIEQHRGAKVIILTKNNIIRLTHDHIRTTFNICLDCLANHTTRLL